MTEQQHEPQPERDPLLAGLLAETPVPDHADGFWADLDRRLVEEAIPSPNVDGSPESNGSSSSHRSLTAGAMAMVSGPSASSERAAVTGVVSVLEPREASSGGRRWLTVAGAGLVAAAAIVVALFGLGVLGGQRSESNVIETDPVGNSNGGAEDGEDQSDADAPDAPDEQANRLDDRGAAEDDGRIDYTQPSLPRELGPGSVLGFSPDGTSVLVLGDHPSGQRGSEGAIVQTVWAYPADGGQATMALAEEFTIETGTSSDEFEIGRGGDIAWVERCDGSVCGLRTGMLRPGGEIVDMIDLDLGDITEQLGQVDVAILDLAISADGTIYVAVNGSLAAATRGFPSIDVAVESNADALAIAETLGGEETLVTWSSIDGVVRTPAGPITDPLSMAGLDLVASPAGAIAAVGESTAAFVDLESGAIELVELGPGAFDVAYGGAGVVTAIISSEGVLFESVDGGDLSGPLAIEGARNGVFAPDAASYAFTRFPEAGTQTAMVVDFPIVPTDPTLAAETADGVAGEQLVEIASFTTEFACCQNRVANIELIAEATDGLVIPDGAAFSLNDATGERTDERGYVVDGAIVNGILEPVIGGGVSQYATTLFNAALFGGLGFDDYQSHSLYISRYPFGRDAALSWPRPDLVLRNDTGHDVMIRNSVTDTSITVSLWSTGSVEVDVVDTVRSAEGSCTRAATERTRTFADGTVLEDTIIAVYRPGEGWDCNGDTAPQTD